MPRINFTTRKLASLKPPGSGQVDYWDTSLPGFGLRFSYGGQRTWIVMYRANGSKRRLKLGTSPPMELADARKDATTKLLMVQRGGDPAYEKRIARQAESFEDLARKYMDEYARPRKRSWKLDEKALWRDAVPRFGKRKAREVSKRDIRDLLDDIKSRGAPIQANRTFEVLRRLFNWAVEQDYLMTSPCVGIKKPSPENRRDRVLRDDEIRSVWKALDAEPKDTAAIFKLRLITAQRGGEIMTMRWQDIDAGWWTVPAERSKNKLSHRVPLTSPAKAILDEIKEAGRDAEWVFPGTITKHRLDVVHATARIRERSGVDFVPHDLRRSVASKLTGDLGVARLTVSKILNHAEKGVTSTYDRHSYDREKRQALEAWGRQLEDIIVGTTTPENIVELHG